MAERGIAGEYADSLLAVAGREKMKRILGEARFFSDVLDAVPDLPKLFSNPAVSSEAKERIVGVLAEKAGFDADLGSFIKIVVSKRRMAIWREIVEAISVRADESEGIVRGKVFSASPLSEARKSALETEISGKLRKKVELESVLSPELIGGCEVRIGSRVYDGTVRRTLEDIRTSLLKR